MNGLVRLRRAFGLGSSQALIRLVCSFISIKLTAVYLGPTGLALIAQFNNLVSLGQGLLGAGINTAAVRLSSEYRDQDTRRNALFATCFKLSISMGLIGATLLLIFAAPLAKFLFTDSHYNWAVVLAGIAIAACLVNSLFLGALNGMREIHLVVRSNIIATIMGLLVFAPSCVLWNINGGIVGSLIAYVITFLTSAYMLRQSKYVSLSAFKGSIDKTELHRILRFYPMLIAHATLTPLSTMLVRDTIISSLSLEAAGLWQGAWRLSEVYTTIITTSVSLYFMPRLGELASQPTEFRREVMRTWLAVTGIMALLALVIYLLRSLVVQVVFSSAFLGVQELMPVQLVGDILKMSAWTLGFVLVATLRTKWYMTIEILVPVVLVGGVHFLTPYFGALGAMWAYVLSSILQLLLALMALRNLLFSRK